MSPESNALVSDDALRYRIGKESLATALDGAVRFRVRGDGPMASREFVPDSSTTAALLQTRQGGALVQQLRVATKSIAGLEDRSNLKGFVLPKDVDSVMASSTLGGAESHDTYSQLLLRAMGRSAAVDGKVLRDRAQSDSAGIVGMGGEALRAQVQSDRADINGRYRRGVAAWNQDGWIIFRPDVARAMLTSVGAFTPPKGSSMRKATVAADIVNHVPTHEVQHSASPVSGQFYSTPGKWMEEAVAEVLSDTPGVLRRTSMQTGVTPESYAGHLAHDSKVDIGWGHWAPQPRSAAEQAENARNVGRNYLRSQDTMRDLLHLGGFRWRSNEELAATKHFLQEAPAQHLASSLADVISKQHDIAPSRRAELAQRIATVVDSEYGLAELRADFGIKS